MAEAEPTVAPPEADPKKKRAVSQMRVPVYSLADAVGVAQVIHERGGGVVSNDQLAAYLGYKSSKNGAYFERVASARLFGMIQGQGDNITITQRAQDILMPVYPDQARAALLDAFFGVPLFKAIYDEFYGKQLPPEFGVKNLMRTRFGVAPSRLDAGWRSLNESAETAGFFATRGNRTQLIIPRVGGTAISQRPEAAALDEASDHVPEEPASAFGGGSGQGGGPPRSPSPGSLMSTDELKGVYVGTLIEMLRAKGEPDPDLMLKIESLLGLAEKDK